MVRLKASGSPAAHALLPTVSIPYGTIKRPTERQPSTITPVSIPYGTIKRGLQHAQPHCSKVSIPYGTIKRQKPIVLN